MAQQFAGEIHHVLEGLAHLSGEGIKVFLDWFILQPAHQGNGEGGLAHDVEHPKALLPHGDQIAAVVILGLALEYFGAATDFGHFLAFRVPAHHTKATVAIEHRLEHHPVAVLKYVEGEHLLGK